MKLGDCSVSGCRFDCAINVSKIGGETRVCTLSCSRDLFLFVKIARHHGDSGVVLRASLLDGNWTNFCKVWTKFLLFCANFLQFWTILDNSLGQNCTYPKRFGQFCTCLDLRETHWISTQSILTTLHCT